MPRHEIDEDRDIGPVFDSEGRPEQAVASDYLRIPRLIKLEDDCLCYQYWASTAAPRTQPTGKSRGTAPPQLAFHGPIEKTPSAVILDEFMKLAAAPDEQILNFARRWGVLDLCKHGLPVGHAPSVSIASFGHGEQPTCTPLAWGDLSQSEIPIAGKEPLVFWRLWAKRAQSLMRVVAAVGSGRPGKSEDWGGVLDGEWLLPDGRPHKTNILEVLGSSLEVDRGFACQLLNQWVAAGQVAPMLVSRGGGPLVVRFSCGQSARVFGVIGLQMTIRASGAGSVAICSNCGKLYKPERLPNPEHENFCLQCGHPAAVLRAKAKLRARKLRALELHRQGVTAPNIAQIVGSKVETVRGWIGKKRPA